ncbi:MBL fold metallo-hydrolase [Umezakia ovalisporum]|uniref:MBL fold metallo-hydrolase n=1 Tax=Umezakia ovalisporum FSS-43 TaxID=2740520 RepID=A0ABT6K531_9CYAN|nr:MBL fold metallo-hydrolase [Umezakia ovalisporum]MDH6057276.1 MBL fold metallo-hydrolase [Umezakia ovalisporum FSS-43]MDH6068768.1 MBL fold metallo-hydrolase [Umezakia ovalisporum APH033B]MDH6070257.1 MBL fold metallo-hydrolase [Umezakia ovalisporum CobakiLakeA]MDH6082380.1 MBL fold metallo-hydrolase [Umezakia ovalisporum FSS-44]MDH6095461.1 MBL fold metallo-hydrolase [Umezakia ovalisporum CobakiLakeB]
MKRRQLIGYAGAGLITDLVTNFASHLKAEAQSSSLSVQWLGHTCFLFTGGGIKILVNPFQTIGCTAGYRSPKVAADLVLISSQLLDEGAVDGLPGKPKIVYAPGAYEFQDIKLQGIAIDHDRKGGRQFGINTAWRWQQGGVNILHLGGAAAPISTEQKILMGRPDVALIPVGGSAKAYNAQEAKQAAEVLNPKLIIPTHYRTQAADAAICNILPVDEFLTLMQGIKVRRSSSDSIIINSRNLPENSEIQLFSYKF